MPRKIKTIIMLVENIGLIAFGIANIFAGVYLWGFHPPLAIAAYAVSLICMVRGASELSEMLFTKGKRG